jgi:hypothetical protein
MLNDPIPSRARPTVKVRMPAAVDFKSLLADLSRSGYGLDSIGMHANLPSYLLRDYQCSGRTVLHEHGERLVALWVEVSGKPRGLVPTC